MKPYRKFLPALLLLLCAVGCSSWERTSFQTLTASNATINNAQQAYEARTLPHNQCVYDIINKAKAAQTLAVDGMLAYEAAKGTTAAQGAENAVTAELSQLAPILASVQTLGTSTCATTADKAAIGPTDWPVIVGTTLVTETK